MERREHVGSYHIPVSDVPSKGVKFMGALGFKHSSDKFFCGALDRLLNKIVRSLHHHPRLELGSPSRAGQMSELLMVSDT
jgi:hypothetical protein